VIGRELIPPLGLSNALVNMDADFVIIAHGELASGQLCGRCLVGIFVGQLFVLFENTFIAKEEPSADTKSGFWNSLLGG
jgi:hypothetical protein